ncbi:hypothetical protein MBM_09810 [Drepanopeziza brunnea f. sp. 'multigermtubi' MB_m1]|uniref:Glycosyl transferase family 8 protein n=2 Tax=Drepanopeziza brunnea f. sp. 'multigermtubi' TaxID=698441 RepID=K1WGP5_MARBU|nr:uncharacterized protein MBM_09810 [Drepanopeziza brunnea f. sp. 'multigermtubi' MB_m1]EKD12026.1 hypothetical protein MBM_09810 [Drepanopeziza brunnea f. sp. 'multigermtubi' MB_m1]
MSLRNRYMFFTTISMLFIFSTLYYHRRMPKLVYTVYDKVIEIPATALSPPTPPTPPTLPAPPPPADAPPSKASPVSTSSSTHTLIYKPQPTAKAFPVVDNFPLAAAAHSAKELPPIPSWNRPPAKHVPESTPLFIGFTRNWRLLQQVVVSYITAGWPPEDIYVVENTGVMDSNAKGRLSLQNPFFLNHTRLHMLGVNVLITPTLFSFAQLQNFYLWHSIQSEWDHYFWSHMDVVALSFEDQYFAAHEKSGVSILPPSDPKHDYSDYMSLYANCLKALRDVTAPVPETGKPIRWAMRFFSYDRLALVNVAAFVEVGGWDTMIPFYGTDCDMHARLEMAHMNIEEVPSGMIFDVASSLSDLIVLYRKKNTTEASFEDPNVIEKELAFEAELTHKKTPIRSPSGAVPIIERDSLKTPSSEAETLTPPDVETQAKDDTSTEAWLEYAAGALHLKPSNNADAKKWEEDEIHSPSLIHLIEVLDAMQRSKGESSRGRNTWQARQTGGEGEPFYRDSAGFEQAIWLTIEHGRNVFREKWGHRDCDIVAMGLTPSDAWRVEHDWKS